MRGLAFDGRCKTFDSRADGFARGEGLGAVLLRKGSEKGDEDLAGGPGAVATFAVGGGGEICGWVMVGLCLLFLFEGTLFGLVQRETQKETNAILEGSKKRHCGKSQLCVKTRVAGSFLGGSTKLKEGGVPLVSL